MTISSAVNWFFGRYSLNPFCSFDFHLFCCFHSHCCSFPRKKLDIYVVPCPTVWKFSTCTLCAISLTLFWNIGLVTTAYTDWHFWKHFRVRILTTSLSVMCNFCFLSLLQFPLQSFQNNIPSCWLCHTKLHSSYFRVHISVYQVLHFFYMLDA